MKIGAIGIRTKIIVGDAATWHLVKKYIDGKIIDLATDYETLNDKPKINDVELSGNKTSEDLGLVPAVEGKSLVDDLEIEKLAGIEENANNYTHPETHPSSILDVVDVVDGAANKFLNERGEMVAVATSSIGVTGSPLYASTANSDVAGYKSLVGNPQTSETEIILTAKSTDGIVWGDKYLSAPFTEAVTIPTTAYGFDYWRKVSAANGTSRKHLRVFLYRAGVETNIITPLASPEIDETEFTERQISYIFPELALLAGDRIGIQEGFSTTHANNVTLTYIVGDGRGWFMRLPLPLKHESLTEKNSEAAFQHIDTETVKQTLAPADMVAVKDSVTGKMVLTPKSNFNDDNLIADYTHTSNKEIHISSIDYATNTFTSVGHGLSNSISDRTTLMLAINRNELIYPYNVMPFANLTGYIQPQGFWIINATPNTFQLSFTNGGSAIVLLNKPETDLTKWHFEYNTAANIEITGLLGKINRGCRAVIDGSFCRFGAAYIGCAAGGKTYYKGVNLAVQEAAFSNWNNSEIPIPSFGGVVVHTDYYTPSGHRKELDVAIYSYTPTLNRIAFLQKVQNNYSPVAIPDANKTSFSLLAGAMITNGTNIKLYTI